MSQCSSCNEPILWGITANNKRMPFDPSPVDEGTWIWISGTHVRQLPKVDLETDVKINQRYRPHWATCPHANEHRRKKVTTDDIHQPTDPTPAATLEPADDW